jgi:UDP-N-acetyl-D-mannosaminuronate dehydrogenase
MRACFMGLGYIGLPTAIVAADNTSHVLDVTNFIYQNVELIHKDFLQNSQTKK